MAIIHKTIEHAELADWLMAGDPAIRWQTMRDLLDKPASQWKREQRKVETTGWGEQLLSMRDASGRWDGGIYTPKWTSTNYTLLLLREMGLPRDNAAGAVGATLLVDSDFGTAASKDFAANVDRMDLCVTGMYLTLLMYFDTGDMSIKKWRGWLRMPEHNTFQTSLILSFC